MVQPGAIYDNDPLTTNRTTHFKPIVTLRRSISDPLQMCHLRSSSANDSTISSSKIHRNSQASYRPIFPPFCTPTTIIKKTKVLPTMPAEEVFPKKLTVYQPGFKPRSWIHGKVRQDAQRDLITGKLPKETAPPVCNLTLTPVSEHIVAVALCFAFCSESQLSIRSNRCNSLTTTYAGLVSADCWPGQIRGPPPN
ncbi:hypothetical protein PspLS_11911 [Pyricularia sp. CBS 133598]|nr:hypothetical protein PspLS_11911 [Pyricularia sp. CBS 133598]